MIMANKKHVKILKHGIKTWNKWREENRKIKPDLSQANLKESDLIRANLSWTNLSGANLFKANLFRADLIKVILDRADLSGAYLRGVNLVEVSLRGANFRSADLRAADIRGATLASDASSVMTTNLTKADLQRAIITPEVNLIGSGSFLDLAACEGLETAKFSDPDFLQNYITRAFEYAHKPGIYEAKEWPVFFEQALEKIKALRKLYAEQEPSEDISKVVGIITTDLIEYLKKHPKAMYEIRPRQFEELVAEILAHYGWQIQLTPAVKDGGYDIFGISKDIKSGVKTSWIIECKKYAPENKIGVDIIRALYGVKSNFKVANALLATTSYFTKGAIDFKASRYDIELKDYSAILEWINEYKPNPDGNLYIKDNKLVLPGDDKKKAK